MKKMASGPQKTAIVTVGAGIVKGFVERVQLQITSAGTLITRFRFEGR